MALSRVKTWIDGEVLFAVDLNGEFNNILNNPITLISPTTGAINFNGQAHTGLVPQAITASSGSTGQILGISPAGTVTFINVGSGVSRVSGLVGTLSSQSATFAADSYSMRSSSNLSWNVTATSSIGASVALAGPIAGGRDTAGAISSTYVHWYAISTGPGSTSPAVIVSTKEPSAGPTLPSSAGYSGWTYLGGSIYSSASTTLLNAHHARGSWFTHDGAVAVLTGGTSTSETAIGTSNTIPPNALQTGLNAEMSLNTNAGGSAAVEMLVRFVTGLNAARIPVQTETASNLVYNSASPTVPSTTLFYIIQGLASTTNINALNATIQVRSYQVPNGGE